MLLGLIILAILRAFVFAQLYPQDLFSRLSRSVEPPSSIGVFYYKFIIFTIYLHFLGGVASFVLSFFGNSKSSRLFGQLMVALGAAIAVTSIPTINFFGLPAGILFLAGGINMLRFAKTRG